MSNCSFFLRQRFPNRICKLLNYFFKLKEFQTDLIICIIKSSSKNKNVDSSQHPVVFFFSPIPPSFICFNSLWRADWKLVPQCLFCLPDILLLPTFFILCLDLGGMRVELNWSPLTGRGLPPTKRKKRAFRIPGGAIPVALWHHWPGA